MRPFFFLAIVFVAALPSHLFSEDLEAFAHSPSWLKLLHYRSSNKSRIVPQDFFLSPEGSRNPFAELKTSLETFKTQPTRACQYPARYLLLKKHFKIPAQDLNTCKEFQKFRSFLNADSVSLIFSSYYINNPSSAFGHTFLRFNQWSKEGTNELLDHAVDFAATPDRANALMYALKGLFGFYPGTFSLKPYFIQVRTYSSFESRDLWSYELNLTKGEVEFLIAIFWEIGPHFFKYYYIDENCSYHILAALEAVRPDGDLLGSLPAVVIPIDTVKVIKHAGWVRSISYRPSLEHQLQNQTKALSDEESKWVRNPEAIDSSEKFKTISVKRQALVLNSALDFIEFRSHYETQFPDSEPAILKRALSKKMAMLGPQIKAASSDIVPEGHPDKVHSLYRASLNAGYRHNLKSFVGIGLRPALHDYLDPSEGFPPYAQIEFVNLSARVYVQKKKFEMNRLTLFNAESLTPREEVLRPISWRIGLGAKQLRRPLCENCFSGFIEGGGGFTWSFLSLLAEAELFGHPDIKSSPVQLGLGPALITKFVENRDWSLFSKASYEFFAFHPEKRNVWKADLKVGWHLGHDFSWNFGGETQNWKERELASEIRYYF